MAASPADPVARAFGGVVVLDPDGPGPASHDGAGRRFVFRPAETGFRHALDVEPKCTPLPAPLARALGGADPALWTEIEVIAKLTDTPAHLVLRAHAAGAGIRPPGLEIRHCDSATHHIAVGRVPQPQARDEKTANPAQERLALPRPSG